MRWSDDEWATAHDTPSVDTDLGRHIVDVATEPYAVGTRITFTFYWPAEDRWEHTDFTVLVGLEEVL